MSAPEQQRLPFDDTVPSAPHPARASPIGAGSSDPARGDDGPPVAPASEPIDRASAAERAPHHEPSGAPEPEATTGPRRTAEPVRAAQPPRELGADPALAPYPAAEGSRAIAERPTPTGRTGPRIHAVGELTRLIRDSLDQPRLRDVWVEGEVGQVTVSSAGHCYFTLKDERSQLRCMVFRDDRMAIPFEPKTGLRLVAHGRVGVYEPLGAYQLYVDTLQPAGFGDLGLQFEALKSKLAAEGLFEPARKRRLPPWPETIGIATSLSGAVLHDMRKVLARRWPLARVVVAACQVQGAGASQTIVAALRRLARWTDRETGRAVDVVILARGGGSLEDLWPFNEEVVVRAIAAHPCPIVVGVGHETDVTLSEFAADVRAPTPSVAAELAVPSAADQLARVRVLRARLAAAGERAVERPRRMLQAERRALDGFRPAAYLAAERERIGLLLDRATRAVEGRLEIGRTRLARANDRLPWLLQGRLEWGRTTLDRHAASLAALGPYATLERGYAIVRDPSGTVVRDASTQQPGSPLSVRLARGELDVRVEDARADRMNADPVPDSDA